MNETALSKTNFIANHEIYFLSLLTAQDSIGGNAF